MACASPCHGVRLAKIPNANATIGSGTSGPVERSKTCLPRATGEASMTRKYERSLEELYRDDPERADAVVFGRKTGPSRRGFLEGAGLAAVGAVVGGTIPF